MTTLTPDRIMEVGMGFLAARTLLSAVELDVFTRLGERAMTGAELTRTLELHQRANPDFFDALVALGFLARDGDGPAARYRNTAETATFLDRARPEYIGGALFMASTRLYRFWADLPEGLRTGKPQNELKHGGVSMFEELYREPARLEEFLDAMAGFSARNFAPFAERFNFAPYRTLCDVGGATGQLSILIARRHPHLRCTTVDLPEVTAIAEKKIATAGLADRITARAVDFFTAPLPRADLITMGMVLHDWNLERKKQLIRAAFDALPESGAFVVIEHLIDDARRENVFGLLMSLNMLIEFGDAFDYSGADFAGWCREAGFRRTEVLPLTDRSSAAIAYR